MSSRFVSGGAINPESGEAVHVAAAAAETKGVEQVKDGDDDDDDDGGPAAVGRNKAEWEAVERELGEERKKREEARARAVEGGEQSLYDILQANKGMILTSPNSPLIL